jgi:hypothetical protein
LLLKIGSLYFGEGWGEAQFRLNFKFKKWQILLWFSEIKYLIKPIFAGKCRPFVIKQTNFAFLLENHEEDSNIVSFFRRN